MAVAHDEMMSIDITKHNGSGMVEVGNTGVVVDGAKKVINGTEPPEIPHIVSNYVPLSQVVANLAIHSHSELQQVVETVQSVTSDVARKRRILDFLVKSRQEFVKLYVLTKWADVSDDISKCIDVVSWLTGQQNCFSNLVNVLYTIERTLGGAKLRNPDIETALEVLKFGEPVQKSHDFIPLEPLSGELVLQTVQDLNVLLSVRLAISEDLLPEHRNYEIADGRVKFTIDDSYVLELAVADDSVDARFFFVGFCFCFDGSRPSVPPLVGAQLEKIVNNMLVEKKLSDVFFWLLKFTQNYKLSIINDQLTALAKGLWSGVVSHMFFQDKSLVVVQYWTSRPGPRNIIRIGLSKEHKIVVQWQREGRPATPPSDIRFGHDNLDVEQLLESIINSHICYIIEGIHNSLLDMTDDEDGEKTKISLISPTKLKLHLLKNRYVTLSIDSLGGRCVLQNSTQLIAAAERALNDLSDVISQAPEVLFKLKYISLQDEIMQRARAAGWVANTSVVLSSADIKRYFDDSETVTVFGLRKPDWALSWFLLVAIPRSGCPKWYMSQLEAKDKSWQINFLELVNLASEDKVLVPEYRLFDDLSKFMTSRFMINSICHQLDVCQATYSLVVGTNTSSGSTVPTIMVNLNTLTKNTWAHSTLLIMLQDNKTAILQGRTKRTLDLPDQKSDLLQTGSEKSSQFTSGGITIDAQSGRFVLRVDIKSGNGDFVNSAVTQLSKIERMVSYAELVKSMSLELKEASMDRISFVYGQDITATVVLGTSSLKDGSHVSLELSENSPHTRVSAALNAILEEEGLLPVVWMLRTTLPMYEALTKLERSSEIPVVVISRSVVETRIIYPKLNISLEMVMVKRKGRNMVYVRELNQQAEQGFKAESKVEDGTKSSRLAKVWTESSGDAVVPLVKGAAAPVDQVHLIFERIGQALM